LRLFLRGRIVPTRAMRPFMPCLDRLSPLQTVPQHGDKVVAMRQPDE